MRIAIIGSGKIGSTVAGLAVRAGHQVAIANSRGPDSLEPLVVRLEGRAIGATVEDAARFGEIVLVAIPLGAYRTLPTEPFAGKIVIDANNYYPSRDGHIAELDGDSTTSSELLAAHLRGARVVKAFNTMYYETLATRGNPDAPREERLALFLAGDDADAMRAVSGLIEELGFAPVDTGTLASGGRLQQPVSEIYNRPLTGAKAERLLAEVAAGAQRSPGSRP
jgi:predicted dinucleotide-binding enzyme